MMKKKLLYKEDKSQANRMKQENEKIVTPLDEDMKKIRGRQISIKKIKNGVCVANSNKKSKEMKISYKADSLEIEEDYYSSGSDCSIRNSKRRELFNENVQISEKLKCSNQYVESLDNTQELSENGEGDEDLIFSNGNNLTKEVERMLIDIYNSNVTPKAKSKIDIANYENYIKIFSKTLNKQYNIFILQILSDKIKELIKRYKEKIFKIPEIKLIRDRYYEIKENLVKKLEEKEMEEKKSNSLKNGKKNGNSGKKANKNLENSQKGDLDSEYKTYDIPSHYTTCDLDINDSDKSVTKILLLELKELKKVLIESSKDIQRVFKLPLSHLRLNNKIVHFSLEEMHREEFANTLLKDEFIEALITQIKTIANELKIEEIYRLLSHIEEDPNKSKREMTRFSSFLFVQLKCLIESDCDCEDSDELTTEADCIQLTSIEAYGDSKLNSNSKYQTSNTSLDNIDNFDGSLSPQVKIAHDIGIDELLEYIEQPDENKTKKIKKSKKKKNKNTKPAVVTTKFEEIDEEVEKFKKIISDTHKNFTQNKIRPSFTQEWLRNIANNVVNV